jgi:hypothetical protein
VRIGIDRNENGILDGDEDDGGPDHAVGTLHAVHRKEAGTSVSAPAG